MLARNSPSSDILANDYRESDCCGPPFFLSFFNLDVNKHELVKTCARAIGAAHMCFDVSLLFGARFTEIYRVLPHKENKLVLLAGLIKLTARTVTFWLWLSSFVSFVRVVAEATKPQLWKRKFKLINASRWSRKDVLSCVLKFYVVSFCPIAARVSASRSASTSS